MRCLALSLLLSLSLTVAHAAAPPQWLPQQSWPGGKQYDPRLEKTVTFWGTGVPAAEVFASLAEQTGVSLGFFPPADDNARICLNLYLNPKQPPTLRDLLVQLGWTLDCAWAVEGKGEQSRYLLLHTTIADRVFEKMLEGMKAEAQRHGKEQAEAAAAAMAAAVAKLPEFREALRLSRDEAIARYRGKDDALLLALLDPARRAIGQLFASLPEADLAQLGPWSGFTRPWEELTPEQQAWAVEAIKPALALLADGVRKGWRPADEQWDPTSGEWELQIFFSGYVGGFAIDVLGSSKQPQANGRSRQQSLDRVGLILYPSPILDELMGTDQRLLDDIALRRLLGEQISDESLPDLAGQYEARRQEEQQRALVEQQLASLCRLSPNTTDRLRALDLPAEPETKYALGQVQEAVAARTGMNVISDHFGQPPRRLEEILRLVSPAPDAKPDALCLLQASCVATSERQSLLNGSPDVLWMLTRWEWGDAGDFLHFRSADRDVWRAALLPADVVATLDGWLAPHLPTDLAADTEATVPLDVRRVGALVTPLTLLQRAWGGALAYGSPLDPAEQWRHAFRLAFAQVTQQTGPPWYTMLSGLDDAQWQQAQSEGLRIGVDFTPVPDLAQDIWGRRYDWAEQWHGKILRLGPPETRTTQQRIGQDPIDEWRWVEVRAEDAPPDERYFDTFATRLTVGPQRLPHLVGTGTVPGFPRPN